MTISPEYDALTGIEVTNYVEIWTTEPATDCEHCRPIYHVCYVEEHWKDNFPHFYQRRYFPPPHLDRDVAVGVAMRIAEDGNVEFRDP